jgi:hypothetical protein
MAWFLVKHRDNIYFAYYYYYYYYYYTVKKIKFQCFN